MYNLPTQKQKANEKIIEAMLEYATACHVENIVKEIDEHKDIDNIHYPAELDYRINKLISDYKRRKKRDQWRKTAIKKFTKVAVFLFIILLGISIIGVGVEAVRLKIFNLVVEVMDEFTSMEVEENEDLSDDSNHIYMPTYIPEGYVSTGVETFNGVTIIQYVNAKGDTILFEQCKDEHSVLRIDTEDAEYKKVVINHVEAFIINKNSMTRLVWHDNEMAFTLMGTLDENELIKIAESITK